MSTLIKVALRTMTRDLSTRAVSRRAVMRGLFGTALLMARPAAAFAGERRISLENPNTGEGFCDVYWCDGGYVAESLRRIDWLMRDFHCDPATSIDPAL